MSIRLFFRSQITRVNINIFNYDGTNAWLKLLFFFIFFFYKGDSNDPIEFTKKISNDIWDTVLEDYFKLSFAKDAGES